MDAISWRLREKIMGLLCGLKWVCIWTTLYPSPQLSCVNNSQSFSRSRKNRVWTDLCQLIIMCVSEHIQHACTRCLMHAPHTSTTDYVVLSSCRFIRLRLWCGIPWSLRNTVLGNETEWICAFHSPEEACHWSLLRLLFSPRFCLLLSITHCIISPVHPSFHKRPLLPSFLLILSDGHYSRSFEPTPTPPVPHVQVIIIKELFGMLLQTLVKWAAGVYFMFDSMVLKWKRMFAWTNWLWKVLACTV